MSGDSKQCETVLFLSPFRRIGSFSGACFSSHVAVEAWPSFYRYVSIHALALRQCVPSPLVGLRAGTRRGRNMVPVKDRLKNNSIVADGN